VEHAVNAVDGTRIAWRRAGSGPPVVMVHGSGLSQVVWRGFGYQRALAAERTVVTLDLRGHGRSEKPHDAEAYSVDLLVADVLAVLDALGTDRAAYVGYSLGGRVGFALAAEHPDRLTRLVSAGGAPRSEPGSFDRLFYPGCRSTLEEDGIDAFVAAWEERSGGLDASTRAAFRANDPAAFAALMRATDLDPGVPDGALTGIRVPSLLLAGSRDRARLAASRHAASLMPAAALQVLEGAGHGDTLRHADALPAVRAFLLGPDD
jgi:pimeloyl-ACP methyl ester carboxylesterase